MIAATGCLLAFVVGISIGEPYCDMIAATGCLLAFVVGISIGDLIVI